MQHKSKAKHAKSLLEAGAMEPMEKEMAMDAEMEKKMKAMKKKAHK